MLIYQQEDGTWATKNIAEIGANIPVDISIAPDDSKIYVNSFGDGTLRVYDVTNPFEGKLIEQVKLGEMANMVWAIEHTVEGGLGQALEGYDTLRRLADSPKHIVPGHDPLVMQRYPAAGPGLEGVAVRLDAEPKL